MKIWRMLEAESRAVELCTAVICMAMALAALVAPADWLPWRSASLAWLAVSSLHAWSATTRIYWLRQGFAAISTAVFAVLAAVMAREYGLANPGFPAFIAACGIQCWVFLALEADVVDARNREARRAE